MSDLNKLEKLAVTIPTKGKISFPRFSNLTELTITTPSDRINVPPRKHDRRSTIVSPIFEYNFREIYLQRDFFQFAANTLQYISLPGSSINYIENGTFSNLTQLKVLDFSQKDMLLLPITNTRNFTTELFQNLSGMDAEDIYLDNVNITEGLSKDLFQAPTLKVLLLHNENMMSVWKYGPIDLTSASCSIFNWQILPWFTVFWIYSHVSQQNN